MKVRTLCVTIGGRKAYIIGVEHLAVGRVLQQESFEAENLTEHIFSGCGEWGELQSINIVFNYENFKDGVKFVENVDPGVEI